MSKRAKEQRPGPCFRRGEKEAKIDDRRKAVRDFDALCAARPLKPPPGRPAPATRTAGALALAEDRRRGIVGGLPFRLGEVDS